MIYFLAYERSQDTIVNLQIIKHNYQKEDMNQDRISQLLEFLESEPDDPFIIYGLAMEYQKSDSREYNQKAQKCFETLLDSFPSYLPTYYHAAAFFADLGVTEKAKDTYKQGIEVANKQGDQHALAELQNAYQNFLFELE